MPTKEPEQNQAPAGASSIAPKAAAETTDNTTAVEKANPAKPVKKKKVSLTALDMNELVEVQSCFYGELFYKSRAGYSVTWSEYGITQPIPVSELIVMRNEQPKFFSKPWVLIVADNAADILSALQIDKYYKQLTTLESFDELFDHNPEEIGAIVANLSGDMKETVARRAFELIKDGTIDSVKLIEALETALGFELGE